MVSEQFRLDGRTAVVVGGRGYLGSRFCVALRDAGANVYAADLKSISKAADSDTDSREALKPQLFSPVRWVETIEKMSADGADQFYECGPGKVLVGLNKRINKALTSAALLDTAAIEAVL